MKYKYLAFLHLGTTGGSYTNKLLKKIFISNNIPVADKRHPRFNLDGSLHLINHTMPEITNDYFSYHGYFYSYNNYIVTQLPRKDTYCISIVRNPFEYYVSQFVKGHVLDKTNPRYNDAYNIEDFQHWLLLLMKPENTHMYPVEVDPATWPKPEQDLIKYMIMDHLAIEYLNCVFKKI